jgi:chromosome segregation ATPase
MKTILNLIQANTEINRLNAEAATKEARLAELEASIETLKESHQKDLADLKATHQTALDEATGKIQLLTEANQLLEDKQESASQQALKVLAQVGVVQPVEENKNTEASTEDKSLDDLWSEYNAITNQKERRAFYIEHIKPRR